MGQWLLRNFCIQRPNLRPEVVNLTRQVAARSYCALLRVFCVAICLCVTTNVAFAQLYVDHPLLLTKLVDPQDVVFFPCGPGKVDSSVLHPVAWWQRVTVEHDDRKKRLLRLATESAFSFPSFSEACVLRSQIIGNPPTDMPVLRIVFPEKSFFDTDKSVVLPESVPALAIIAKSMSQEPSGVTVFVAGHTDSRGGDDYNFELSRHRADAVASRLVQLGVGESQVWLVGFGKAYPIASNANAQGQAINRRVEFLIGATPEAIQAWIVLQQPNPCFLSKTSASHDCKPAPTHQIVVAQRLEPVKPGVVGPAKTIIITLPDYRKYVEVPRK